MDRLARFHAGRPNWMDGTLHSVGTAARAAALLRAFLPTKQGCLDRPQRADQRGKIGRRRWLL